MLYGLGAIVMQSIVKILLQKLITYRNVVVIVLEQGRDENVHEGYPAPVPHTIIILNQPM